MGNFRFDTASSTPPAVQALWPRALLRRRGTSLSTGLGIALLIALPTACRPGLDADPALVGVPASLPALEVEPKSRDTMLRALELAREGDALVVAGNLKAAIPKLTEAVAADPSLGIARLALARAFARAGRASVALALFEPALERAKTCGMCVELLHTAAAHEDFAHLRATAQGQAFFARVPTEPLPWQEWALRVADALQKADGAALAPYAHPTLPFDFVRACPSCANEAVRSPQRRTLTGAPAIAKVAGRFDTKDPNHLGVALRVTGEPACADACCVWTVPEPVPVGTAALARVCLRAATPITAHLTEVAVTWGAPVEP
ncbi:MAG: hypothetical protein EXR79_09360 [Myxococcales bacterium]|nr:hypothetical protein [Myxococcales bacterium]